MCINIPSKSASTKKNNKDNNNKKEKVRLLKPRYGFSFECKQCGVTNRYGGYESKSQVDKILAEQRKAHADHKAFVKVERSAHAAELTHIFQSQSTRQTSTSTSYVDFTNNSIAAASFTAGKKYLISCTAVLDASTTSLGAKIRLVHGTTPTAFADSEFQVTPVTATTSRLNYAWWTVYTQPGTAELVKAQIAISAAGTVGIDQFTLVAIKLSDDLTEDTGSGGDWKFNEVAASTSLLSSGDSTTNNATVTITPANAGNKWLVLTRSRITCTIATRSAGTRIVRSGEASSTGPFCQVEPQAATDIYSFSLPRVFSLGASSNTFTEKSFSVTANAHTRTHSGVFVLNLSKLRNEADTYDENVLDLSAASAFATTVATTSITPAVQGDVWIGGFFSCDLNATGINFKGRIQIDNTTDITSDATTDSYTLWQTKDAADECPYNTQGLNNLTAASHTLDLDGSVSAATAGRGARGKTLFAVTMEIPPNALVKIPTTDTVTITETTLAPRALSRVPTADTVTLTESLARPRVLERQNADTVTLAESATRLESKVRVADADTVSLTESAIKRGALVRRFPETAADYVAADFTDEDFAVGEEVGIGESVVSALTRSLVKSVSDSVTITEAVQRLSTLLKIADADSVGITETVIRLSANVRIPATDTVSITDTELAARALVRTAATDPVVITEAAQRLSAIVKEATDSVAISEVVARYLTLTRFSSDDSVTITESPTKLSSKTRIAASDSLTITETTHSILQEVSLELVKVVDDALTISDANNIAVLVQTIIKIVTEPINITDVDIVRLRELARTPATDNVNISESVIKTQALVKKAATDLIAISEGLVKAQALIKTSPTDTITLTESDSALRGLARSVSDSVSITEQTSRISAFGLVKQVSDSISITESTTKKIALGVIPETVSNITGAAPGGKNIISRRRRGAALRRYLKPELKVVGEEEEKPEEIPPLLTKVTIRFKFAYSISSAQVFEEGQQIQKQLDKLLQQQYIDEQAREKARQIEQKLIEPITAEDLALGSRSKKTIEQTPEQARTDALPRELVKVYSAIKMPYNILNKVGSTFSASYNIYNSFCNTHVARYAIKDGRLLQQLVKIGGLIEAMDIGDDLEE